MSIGNVRILNRRWMLGMLALALTAPGFSDIVPDGSVNNVGGDPADDGPIQPTTGDLILPDSDTILIGNQSSLLVDGGSLLRVGAISN